MEKSVTGSQIYTSLEKLLGEEKAADLIDYIINDTNYNDQELTQQGYIKSKRQLALWKTLLVIAFILNVALLIGLYF